VRDLVRQHRAANGDAVALLAPGLPSLTYGRLIDQIDNVGRAIRHFGIERSDRVAVALSNGPDMAVAFLGVASFATCAPLNPQLRHEEFEFYLKDLEARAVIVPGEADSAACEVAQRLGLSIVCLFPGNAVEGQSAEAGRFELKGRTERHAGVLDPAQADDVAMVLHTSGTTSRPKLVPLSHRNLCASARNIQSVLSLTGNDRCLNVMPLYHIHGLIGALLSSMAAGASVICSKGYDEATFAECLGRCEPTWYSAVPTIHQSVLAQTRRDPSLVAGHRLRFIRSSSASLPPAVMQELETTFGVPVVEAYGMTEASHQMASNPLPPATRKAGCVGLPAGPEMAIMDDAGRLLPPGEVGEIVIRGPNVTNGYHNNPDANRAAFCNGWFRTGDRGRTDQDGYFYITGRTKEMINRGGENISPREIDEVLLQHPAVAQAVAFALPHRRLGEDVAAAIVLRENAAVSGQELRQFALSRLADFKVPSQIVFVADIPKGPTGKLQRIGLHEKLQSLLRPEFAAPRTETESALIESWQDVLPGERIGIHDNFFGLGGDSLLAARLLARINARFDLQLTVQTVFRAPTVADQALLVEETLVDEFEREAERSNLEI
jgi:acyl-CoA synthetase (AMP-forming)/AMP-acid ligase II